MAKERISLNNTIAWGRAGQNLKAGSNVFDHNYRLSVSKVEDKDQLHNCCVMSSFWITNGLGIL